MGMSSKTLGKIIGSKHPYKVELLGGLYGVWQLHPDLPGETPAEPTHLGSFASEGAAEEEVRRLIENSRAGFDPVGREDGRYLDGMRRRSRSPRPDKIGRD